LSRKKATKTFKKQQFFTLKKSMTQNMKEKTKQVRIEKIKMESETEYFKLFYSCTPNDVLR